jgi:hypothetical protein
MRCDHCGREIPSGEKSEFTTFEVEGAPIGTRAYPVRGTRTVPLLLCEACAARRQSTQRWILWTLMLTIGGVIVLGILIRLIDIFT